MVVTFTFLASWVTLTLRTWWELAFNERCPWARDKATLIILTPPLAFFALIVGIAGCVVDFARRLVGKL
jgi:hypothetical protein